MLDLEKERPISLAKAARLVPSARGDHPSPTTIWRWSRRGIRSTSGARVYLETRRYGAARCTSAEAVARFVAALNAEPAPARDLDEEARAKKNTKLEPTRERIPKRST